MSNHFVFRVNRVTYEPALAHDAFTLTCSDWCNILAETENGEIVFVWQYRFGTDAMSLEIPGGLIERGEDPAAAALRELLEETGYEAASAELVSIVEPNPALQNNRLFTYLARGAKPTGTTAFDPMEDLETVLIPAEDIGPMIDAGEIKHALAIVALEAYLRRFATRAG